MSATRFLFQLYPVAAGVERDKRTDVQSTAIAPYCAAAMTDALVLDSLLGLIILLSTPIGFWRGVAKEVFVSASILLGMAVAAAWVDRWSGEFGAFFSLGGSTARFLTAIGAVLIATLVLGYGGAAVSLRGQRIGFGGRMAGAIVAAANAALLLSWSLSVIARDLADARALEAMEEGHIARYLLNDPEWIVLGISGVALVAVLIGFVATTVKKDGVLPEIDASAPVSRGAGHPDRLRPVRIPRDADTGKYEPEARRFDPRTGRYGVDAAGLSPSMPLAGVDPSRWSSDTSTSGTMPAWGVRRDRAVGPRNGGFTGREWLRRTDEQSRSGENKGEAEEWTPRRRSEGDRCGACGSPIGAADAFCPRCGSTMAR